MGARAVNRRRLEQFMASQVCSLLLGSPSCSCSCSCVNERINPPFHSTHRLDSQQQQLREQGRGRAGANLKEEGDQEDNQEDDNENEEEEEEEALNEAQNEGMPSVNESHDSTASSSSSSSSSYSVGRIEKPGDPFFSSWLDKITRQTAEELNLIRSMKPVQTTAATIAEHTQSSVSSSSSSFGSSESPMSAPVKPAAQSHPRHRHQKPKPPAPPPVNNPEVSMFDETLMEVHSLIETRQVTRMLATEFKQTLEDILLEAVTNPTPFLGKDDRPRHPFLSSYDPTLTDFHGHFLEGDGETLPGDFDEDQQSSMFDLPFQPHHRLPRGFPYPSDPIPAKLPRQPDFLQTQQPAPTLPFSPASFPPGHYPTYFPPPQPTALPEGQDPVPFPAYPFPYPYMPCFPQAQPQEGYPEGTAPQYPLQPLYPFYYPFPYFFPGYEQPTPSPLPEGPLPPPQQEQPREQLQQREEWQPKEEQPPTQPQQQPQKQQQQQQQRKHHPKPAAKIPDQTTVPKQEAGPIAPTLSSQNSLPASSPPPPPPPPPGFHERRNLSRPGSPTGDKMRILREEIIRLRNQRLVQRFLFSDLREQFESVVRRRLLFYSTTAAKAAEVLAPKTSQPSKARQKQKKDEAPEIAPEPQVAIEKTPTPANPSSSPSSPSSSASFVTPSSYGAPEKLPEPLLPSQQLNLDTLFKEVQELKALMKMCLTVQVDIQKSIKEEVLTALSGGTLPSPTPNHESLARCKFCDEKADCVLYRCGHLCCCEACGKRLQMNNLPCPTCQAPIMDTVKVHK